jgi:hypothetical protein
VEGIFFNAALAVEGFGSAASPGTFIYQVSKDGADG